MITCKIDGVIINLDNVTMAKWCESQDDCNTVSGLLLRFVGGIDSILSPQNKFFKDSPASRLAYKKLCEYVTWDFDETVEDDAKDLPGNAVSRSFSNFADEPEIIGWVANRIEDEDETDS